MSNFKNMFKFVRYCLFMTAVLLIPAEKPQASCGPADPVTGARLCTGPAMPLGILISSCEELHKIGWHPDYPLNGKYLLTADIDMSGCLNTEMYVGANFGAGDTDWERMGWAPIGRSFVDFSTMPCPPEHICPPPPSDDNAIFDRAFTGTFDGNGHTISGLYVNRQHQLITDIGFVVMSSGLFGSLDGAVVKNLNIEADTVAVYSSYSIRTAASGILAGLSRNSKITNVNVKGTVIGYVPSPSNYNDFNMHAGGLVGRSILDSISNSSASVTMISGTNTATTIVKPIDKIKAGGLVGTNMLSVISRSRAVTEINGEGGSAGGLAGENLGGTITRSYANAKIHDARFQNIGGLAGINTGLWDLFSCPECDGGPMVPGTITESYSRMSMTNQESSIYRVGGLVGYHHTSGEISNSYSIGAIEIIPLLIQTPVPRTSPVIGGLVGVVEDQAGALIYNSYAAVTLTGAPVIGGLIGAVTGDMVRTVQPAIMPMYHHCYWNTDLIIGSDGNHHGTGKTTAEMGETAAFEGWDFQYIWRMPEWLTNAMHLPKYPYLAWENDLEGMSISKNHNQSSINKNKTAPTVTVRGKMLNVKTASQTENLQIRLIDMRGRTLMRFNTTGSGSFSLSKISAGRYIVEIKDMKDKKDAKRFTSSIVLR